MNLNQPVPGKLCRRVAVGLSKESFTRITQYAQNAQIPFAHALAAIVIAGLEFLASQEKSNQLMKELQ